MRGVNSIAASSSVLGSDSPLPDSTAKGRGLIEQQLLAPAEKLLAVGLNDRLSGETDVRCHLARGRIHLVQLAAELACQRLGIGLSIADVDHGGTLIDRGLRVPCGSNKPRNSAQAPA